MTQPRINRTDSSACESAAFRGAASTRMIWRLLLSLMSCLHTQRHRFLAAIIDLNPADVIRRAVRPISEFSLSARQLSRAMLNRTSFRKPEPLRIHRYLGGWELTCWARINSLISCPVLCFGHRHRSMDPVSDCEVRSGEWIIRLFDVVVSSFLPARLDVLCIERGASLLADCGNMRSTTTFRSMPPSGRWQGNLMGGQPRSSLNSSESKRALSDGEAVAANPGRSNRPCSQNGPCGPISSSKRSH